MPAHLLRSLLALASSTALLATGCAKSSESDAKPESDATHQSDAKPEADATPGREATPPTTTPTPPADAGSLAAVVESMVEAEVSYPAELDALLDLVPAGSHSFMVVRDVDDLLSLADASVKPLDPALRSFAAALDGDASADVAQALDGYAALATGLRGSGFDLSKGVVMGDVAGDGVVIYGGAAEPDALPTLLRALGASGDDMPDECTAVADVPGYAVCAKDAAVLAKYAPGKGAAAARTKLGERLGVADIDRANVLLHVGKDDDPKEHVTLALATTPGLVHFTMGLAESPDELARVLSTGPSPALGLLAPGSSFTWTKVDPTMITEQAKGQPFIVRNVLGTLTGEVLLGTLADSGAMAVLAGVSDPAPVGGLVALAGMQAGEVIPKKLPDGSEVAVATETMTIGGTSTQVLHLTMKPTAKNAELFAKMKLVPEAWLFAAGGYAGVVFGAGKEAVESIGGYAGGSMTPEVVRVLPKPLAQDLVDGDVAMAMHVALDGLQGPILAESFEDIAKEMPDAELPPGMTPEGVMKLARSIMAPMSGVSVWMGPPKDRMVVHVAISVLGDPRTEEGKAAMAAMSSVAAGGDPVTVYGELAGRFSGSQHVTAYEARAGKRSDGAAASVAMLGVLAAVAIPAVLEYRARSEAALAVPMPPALPE